MCVVSMVMDHYRDRWTQEPYQQPQIQPSPFPNALNPFAFTPTMPTQAEVDEFHKLLARAREYDKRNNEPMCELQEKKDALLAIAKALGISICLDPEDDGA